MISPFYFVLNYYFRKKNFFFLQNKKQMAPYQNSNKQPPTLSTNNSFPAFIIFVILASVATSFWHKKQYPKHIATLPPKDDDVQKKILLGFAIVCWMGALYHFISMFRSSNKVVPVAPSQYQSSGRGSNKVYPQP